MPFVLQMGPYAAMIDPNSGPKILQIENFCRKSAGQAKKQGPNALFSMTSLSHKMRGTSVGQGWDTGQAGYEKFL
jgi:hypothetical protein